MSGTGGDSTNDKKSTRTNRFEWPISISVRNPLTVSLGTLLIIGAVGAAFGIASNPYSHGSGEYEGSFEEGSDLHYRYEDLSPQAQEIFRQTLVSEESVDTSEKAPDFEYSKGTNIYIIEYQNELYALSVSVERNSFFFTGAFILGAIGVVLLVHGSGRFH